MSTPLSQLPPPTIGSSPSHQENNPLLPPASGYQGNMEQFTAQQMPQQQYGSNDNSQLVDDILAGIQDAPEMENSNIDTGLFNRSMDSSQVPPEKKYSRNKDNDLEFEEFGPNNTNNTNNNNNNNSLVLNAVGINSNSTVGKIYNHAKLPVIVFVVCFLISYPPVNRIVFSAVPNLLLESGQVSLQGVLFKALIGLVLFYIASLVV